MRSTPRYTLADLYEYNRAVADKRPEVWAKFRWHMRGTHFGREELNDAFEHYRSGWYHAILYTRKASQPYAEE